VLLRVRLIRSGGHLPKGGCDVPDHRKPARRVRRRFSGEFKEQTVRLVLEEGRSVNAVVPCRFQGQPYPQPFVAKMTLPNRPELDARPRIRPMFIECLSEIRKPNQFYFALVVAFGRAARRGDSSTRRVTPAIFAAYPGARRRQGASLRSAPPGCGLDVGSASGRYAFIAGWSNCWRAFPWPSNGSEARKVVALFVSPSAAIWGVWRRLAATRENRICEITE
jgi:hypothetical protein